MPHYRWSPGYLSETVRSSRRSKKLDDARYILPCGHTPYDGRWPEICRFLGIIISIYYKEHAPPHFHAKYGGQRAAFSINELKIIEGSLPKRVISLILEWAFEHRDALMEDWELAERNEDLKKIDPLI